MPEDGRRISAEGKDGGFGAAFRRTRLRAGDEFSVPQVQAVEKAERQHDGNG